MKVPAMLILSDLLSDAGVDQEEIDYLLSKYLEEEAFDYVDFVRGDIGIEEVEDVDTTVFKS